MNNYSNINRSYVSKLYNKILFLSRNKLLYTEFDLNDTFQNRINLIFLHSSFLFIKIKEKNANENYKIFYQSMFDFIFNKIEQNMRELGWGDVTVNKKMKHLIKIFYNILLNCEKYRNENKSIKDIILRKYLEVNKEQKRTNTRDLTEYFDKYLSFCIDLTPDNVLKGELNFNYK
tara:strand:- start:990 stop:1514 length:525 start_codon:yes stop_codon:yes gene_type:complete